MKPYRWIKGTLLCTTLTIALPLSSVQATTSVPEAIETNTEEQLPAATTVVEEESTTSQQTESEQASPDTAVTEAPQASDLDTPVAPKTTDKPLTQESTPEKTTSLQATSQTYNDWFPDDNLASAVAQALGDVSTDVVTDTTLAQLTRLDCPGRGIQDMTGLEWLTGLTYLNCNSNQLTSLDASQNPSLTYLYCSKNLLTSLDVSQNPLLTHLYCYNNQLTSLDVSHNPQLSTLYCDNNQLSILDVSQNLELYYLVCSDNQLTSLDLSQNLQLGTLLCYNNQLVSLDVSQNLKLSYLSCFNNQLTSLDLSQNPLLTSLYCYNNQLTSLDVSHNPQLNQLECSNNQLKDIHSFAETRVSSTRYTSYSAGGQHITEAQQVPSNETLVYHVPADLLDKDGQLVTNITPQNGGVYNAQDRTITWENISSEALTYTFESADSKFSGTITVPVKSSLPAPIVTADKEITYQADSTITEATFLADINATTNDGSTVTSDFATVVDLNTPGDYTVTLQAVNADGIAATPVQVLVHVSAEAIIPPDTGTDTGTDTGADKDTDTNTPIAPAKEDRTKVVSSSDTVIEKTTTASAGMVLSEGKSSEVGAGDKHLPKTGDTSSRSIASIGITLLAAGVFLMRKPK